MYVITMLFKKLKIYYPYKITFFKIDDFTIFKFKKNNTNRLT